MDFAGYWASIAANFKNHYLEMARDTAPLYPVRSEPTPTVEPTPAPTPEATAPVDSYLPSGETNSTPTVNPDADTTEPETGTGTPTADNPVTVMPNGTYTSQQMTRLDYQLKLRFDLSAITQTVERISEGDSEAISDFAAAGFGLKTKFDLSGFTETRTSGTVNEETGHTRSMTAVDQRNRGKMAVQSRNFALKSFYNEATKVRRSMSESVHGSHRRAVSKFALRYRLDSRFSFASASQFHVQTKRVAEEIPAAVEGYVNTAGEMAATSSTELMASFFSAVDSYLDETETAVLEKVTAFFDQATKELGLSGALVDQARENLAGTIETFFDRVDTALAGVQARFAPTPEIVAPAVEPQPILPAELVPPDLYNPVMPEDKYDLATA